MECGCKAWSFDVGVCDRSGWFRDHVESLRERNDDGRRAWNIWPILARKGMNRCDSASSVSESGSWTIVDFHRIRSHLRNRMSAMSY